VDLEGLNDREIKIFRWIKSCREITWVYRDWVNLGWLKDSEWLNNREVKIFRGIKRLKKDSEGLVGFRGIKRFVGIRWV